MSEETELIKERLNIADVVGEYAALKPAGQNLKALCPFHQEKTPSFIVSPGRGTWHCFGSCSEGGDIFTFIQKVEGVDFPAALKMLAERAGIQLKASSPQTTSRRARLLDLLAGAGRLYHEVMMNQSAGSRAKQYLLKRGVTEKTMTEFQIGYAPDAWDFVQKWLKKKGFTEEEMVGTGLVGRSQRGQLFDRFRGRIMFPIADTQGRIIAFGGRIVPWLETGNEGKYVNSPETALYEKRRVVYNLSRAKKALRSGQPCIVVEGYMDVVMLVQAGMENVVATSGTALTDDHVAQLRRFTKTLHFAFDADAAGFKAGVAATGSALAAGMKVATVVLPPGKDPADLVLENPTQAQETMKVTEPLTRVLLRQLKEAGDATTQEAQLEALLPLLQQVKNPIQQGEMVQEVADTLHVPASRIQDLMRRLENSQPRARSTRVPEAVPALHLGENSRAERYVLGLLILQRDVRNDIFPHLSSECFLDPASLTLYNDMQRIAEKEPTFFAMSSDELVGHLQEEHITFAEGLRGLAEELLLTTSQSAATEGRALLRSLQRRVLKSKLSTLQQGLVGGEGVERDEALRQFQVLAQQLSTIDNS